jgi:prepilin-type N-terminal cleavage/methylation domain-containing protein/prepilin-type processing-associated H-X9-DG protein
MNRKAFTLIELLVVIAIIAILAAILFPVFAQAKLAAKKTSSLSNTKQITLSAIMYGGDADDFLPLSQSGPFGNITTPYPGTTTYAQSWVGICQPYIKSLGLMDDPGMGDALGIFGSGANSWTGNWNRYPEFGYNYLFLSPFWQCSTSLGRNFTAAVKPAETVMFATTSGQTGTEAPVYGWYDANAPGAWPIVAPAPNACIWYESAGKGYTGNWSANNPANIGRMTSFVRTITYNQGANVGWVDGHAKYMKDGALAAGTDYGNAVYSNGNAGAQVTNLSLYLWSLDGTLNDLNL